MTRKRRTAKGGRWNPRKFVEAILTGKTQAEAASLAGSGAVGREALTVQGARWMKHPKVIALIRDADPLLEEAWAHGAKYCRDVLAGHVEGTNMDKTAAMQTVGRALAKFVTKVEVEHRVLRFRDFTRPKVIDAQLVPTPALPAPSEPHPIAVWHNACPVNATARVGVAPAFALGDVRAEVAKPAPMPEEG